MQIINDSFHGFRQFAAGIIAHGDKLGDWVACRDLQATRLSLPVVIGGVEIKVNDGSDLLRELITAAKVGKLSKDEADVIASQLDTINFRFDHRRCVYWCVLSIPDENTLTEEAPSVKLDEAENVQESPSEDVVPAKKGRKAKA